MRAFWSLPTPLKGRKYLEGSRARIIVSPRDGVVIECDEDQVEEVKAWLKWVMVNGMEEILNSPPKSRVATSLSRWRSRDLRPGVGSSLCQRGKGPACRGPPRHRAIH